MDICIIYSSRTGNTKKIAEALYEEFSSRAELFSVEEVPDLTNYKYVFVGGWADKGRVDAKTQALLQTLEGKRVGLFVTLGAYPYSLHAHKILVQGASLLPTSNKVIGTFVCQGAVDPRLLKRFETMPKDDPHYPTPGNRLRQEIAATHPDEDDLRLAKDTFAKIMERDIDG